MRAITWMTVGVFLIIFGIDGILLLDSAMPECRGFTSMGIFVFITLGFDSRAILSNPDCLDSFYIQMTSGILTVIGIGIALRILIRNRNGVQNNCEKIPDRC